MYNLEVDGFHEFFADTILVHNSAAVGMGLVVAIPETLPGGKIVITPVNPQKVDPLPVAVPPPRQDWAQRRGLFGMR